MTVKEIAKLIAAHLKRFESDPKINRYDDQSHERLRSSDLRPYYFAHAWANGRYVRVMYISYQGSTALTKDEAERYLEKLDSGFVGRHYEALRET